MSAELLAKFEYGISKGVEEVWGLNCADEALNKLLKTTSLMKAQLEIQRTLQDTVNFATKNLKRPHTPSSTNKYELNDLFPLYTLQMFILFHH